MSTDANTPERVFVSYSSKDKPWADAACAMLEGHGVRCWVAPRDIKPGTEWGAEIIAGIDACRVMVIIFSDNANQSPQVRREVERAVSKGLTLIPCRVEDVRPIGAMEYALMNTHWLDVFTPPVEDHMERLAEAVQLVLAASRAPGATTSPVLAQPKPAAAGDEFIRFNCPACGKRIKATQAQAGRQLRCTCGQAVTVPAAAVVARMAAGMGPTQSPARMPPPVPLSLSGQQPSRSFLARHWPWLAAIAAVLLVAVVGVVILVGFFFVAAPHRSIQEDVAVNAAPTVSATNAAPGLSAQPPRPTATSVETPKPAALPAPQLSQSFMPAPPSPVSATPSPAPPAQRVEVPIASTVNIASLEPKRRNTLKMDLVLIKPGSFIMGKDSEEFNERPSHQVTLTHPFYMGVYEVTRGQFRAFVTDLAYHGGKPYLTDSQRDGKGCYGYYKSTGEFTDRQPRFTWDNTGFDQTDDHPVVNVSWNDAVEFCKWLSKRENAFYGLPTEAEWEYTCRAGTTTPWFTGNTERSLVGYCNYKDLAYDRVYPPKSAHIQQQRWDDGFAFTAPVGSFKPNPWGVHDLLGNVAEWCADPPRKYIAQDETDPVGNDKNATEFGVGKHDIRGGHWDSEFLFDFKTTARGLPYEPTEANYDVGFRVVMRPGVKVW